jgi:excisionase family DNA binding protein
LAVTSAHSGCKDTIALEARYYTVKEAAEYLRFSPVTIYRNANSGRLLGKRYGRNWRFTQEQLDSFLTDHKPVR